MAACKDKKHTFEVVGIEKEGVVFEHLNLRCAKCGMRSMSTRLAKDCPSPIIKNNIYVVGI